MLFDMTTRISQLLYACPDAACSEVAWRPDGKVIAFDHVELNSGNGMPPGATRVWVYDLDSNQAQPLFKDTQQLGYSPRWSPDGQKLAVYDSGNGVVVVHDFKTDQR